MRQKTRRVVEFGDFQTPDGLALRATRRLHALGIRPRTLIEPTCGTGAFLAAGADVFRDVEWLVGIDVNHSHLARASARLSVVAPTSRLHLREGDFFRLDWDDLLAAYPEPWLILGNPPWVTSAELGSIQGTNLPQKSNFQGHTGMEARTGKSNFDISEWMLLQHLRWLTGRAGTIAMLCKIPVARKILRQVWKQGYPIATARIYKINAMRDFGAAVDACFFVLETGSRASTIDCELFDDVDAERPSRTLSWHDGILVNDRTMFARWRHLLAPEEHYTWRSGVKHDCSNIMELTVEGHGVYRNGVGQTVQIEDTYLFPMFKSSDIANGRRANQSVMLVTQRTIGEDTAQIEARAPRTWRYLQEHAALFARRASSIYQNRPPFSIFGVGDYSFAPWKVAISGFYKRLQFTSIGPIDGRPAVFDDTVYFLPCWSEAEAHFLAELLNSTAAREFYTSMISWADKRPVTAQLLGRLSIERLAASWCRQREYEAFTNGSATTGQR